MKWFGLAFIIWIAKIIMWISIIGIPFERYLSSITNWFDCPFLYADVKSSRR